MAADEPKPGSASRLWDDLAVTDPRSHSNSPVPRPNPRVGRTMASLVGRSSDVQWISVMLFLGVGLLAAGLELVRGSPQWDFTYGGAVSGVLSQLAVTGPAAVLVAVAAAANVLAGAVALRWFGTPAYRNVSEVVLAGFAAAVVLDAAVLFLLGSFGLFGWPELLALHAAVAGVYEIGRASWRE